MNWIWNVAFDLGSAAERDLANVIEQDVFNESERIVVNKTIGEGVHEIPIQPVSHTITTVESNEVALNPVSQIYDDELKLANEPSVFDEDEEDIFYDIESYHGDTDIRPDTIMMSQGKRLTITQADYRHLQRVASGDVSEEALHTFNNLMAQTTPEWNLLHQAGLLSTEDAARMLSGEKSFEEVVNSGIISVYAPYLTIDAPPQNFVTYYNEAMNHLGQWGSAVGANMTQITDQAGAVLRQYAVNPTLSGYNSLMKSLNNAKQMLIGAGGVVAGVKIHEYVSDSR